MLLACGGGGDATAPDPGPPDDDPPPVDDNPGPPVPTPTNNIAGAYALVLINDAGPGQMVTLANPDGNVIGLYRFSENTTLGLTEEQTWSLSLRFEDERNPHHIEDQGRFKRSGEDGKDLLFTSETYGDQFIGGAWEGMAVIKYDVDGDGEADTVFGFQRILGPGD